MASVYKKQNKWWLKYKDATGKQRDIPTACDTKASARRLGQELEIKSERQRLGLEPMPVKERVTFGAVMDRWWAERGPLLRSKTIQPFADKHLRPVLGNKALDEITLPVLEEIFSALQAALSAQSCNHLRSYIRKLFKYARRRELWRGGDPTEDLKKVKGPKKQPEYLRPDEAALLMRELRPRWRPLFAAALFTGMRKGELLALRKTDVDLVNGTIVVRRSNNFDTTKGSHEDELPIAEELRPYLETALGASDADFVFTGPKGNRLSPDVQLQDVLRRALGRAGVVTGYEHKCRRKGCGFREKRGNSAAARCPRCSMKLWVTPLPKKLRFHDIRHTTAALLLKSKVPLAVVQKVLRHSDPGITANVYGNIGQEDIREAVNTLGERVMKHLRVVAEEPIKTPAAS